MNETTRAVVYNAKYRILAPVVVQEGLVYDTKLEKNVWANPNFLGYAMPNMGE